MIGSQSWVISKVNGHVSSPLLSIDLPNMIIWWNINCSWFWIFRSCPMFCRFDTQLYVVLNHNCIKKLVKPKCYPSNFSSWKLDFIFIIFFCILFWRLEGVIWKQRFKFCYWKLFEWWLYVFSSKCFKVWSVKAFEVGQSNFPTGISSVYYRKWPGLIRTYLSRKWTSCCILFQAKL